MKRCSECGREAPTRFDTPVYVGAWPFGWCPWCVDKEMEKVRKYEMHLTTSDAVGTMEPVE